MRRVARYDFGGGLTGALSGASTGAPFGPWGAAAGGVVGGVLGWFGGDDKKKKEEEAAAKEEAQRQEMMLLIKRQQDNAVLSSYPTRGITGQFYAYGGKMPRCDYGGNLRPVKKDVGGYLNSVASDAQVVSGDTHEQDSDGDGSKGVTITNNGNPIANVEDGEVIIGDKVFSKRLGMDIPAKTLADKKGMLEKEMSNSNNVHTKNTLQRELEKVDSDVNNLFQKQEQMKQAAGIPPQSYENVPMAKFGDKIDWGKAGQVLSTAGSFLDNYLNQDLINNVPTVKSPVLETPTPLITTYNVAPQIGAVDRTLKARVNDINANTNDSNVARGNKQQAFVDSLVTKGQIYGDQMNKETELKNANSLNQQTVTGRNVGRVGEYDMNVNNRATAIRNMQSANNTNLSEDIRFAGQDMSKANLDLEKVKINALEYGDTGIMDNFNDIGIYKQALSDKNWSQKMYDSLKLTNKTRAEKLKADAAKLGVILTD